MTIANDEQRVASGNSSVGLLIICTVLLILSSIPLFINFLLLHFDISILSAIPITNNRNFVLLALFIVGPINKRKTET